MATITALPQLGFTEAIKLASSRILDFNGRSRRSELWWWMLIVILVDQIVTSFATNLWVNAILSIVIMFFGLSVTVRRLHDTNRNGLWVYVSYGLGIIIQIMTASSAVMTKMTEMAMSGQMDQKAITRLLEKNMGEFGTICGLSTLWMILSLIVIIFCLIDSKPELNKYGESPKYIEAANE